MVTTKGTTTEMNIINAFPKMDTCLNRPFPAKRAATKPMPERITAGIRSLSWPISTAKYEAAAIIKSENEIGLSFFFSSLTPILEWTICGMY
ncbi:hypothetical protein D3H55_14180 [Bacillus salacetis]|uniref:Uncharacterized protein n=1 Tax=Bacillus salacetis TaxID=2315464 RepID=A0A3A1QWM1_9BACI|nr:hypothetical protein D3H55_14180 [Bacillus salacetis]